MFYGAVGSGAPGSYPHATGLALATLLGVELLLAALTTVMAVRGRAGGR